MCYQIVNEENPAFSRTLLEKINSGNARILFQAGVRGAQLDFLREVNDIMVQENVEVMQLSRILYIKCPDIRELFSGLSQKYQDDFDLSAEVNDIENAVTALQTVNNSSIETAIFIQVLSSVVYEHTLLLGRKNTVRFFDEEVARASDIRLGL